MYVNCTYMYLHMIIHIIHRGVEIVSQLPDILAYFQHPCPAPHILCIQLSFNLPDIYWTMSCMTGCFHTPDYTHGLSCIVYDNTHNSFTSERTQL